MKKGAFGLNPRLHHLRTMERLNKRSAVILLIIILWIALVLVALNIDKIYSTKQHQVTVGLAEGKHGAVATENKQCSEIGLQVLRDGGSAVDSAVATCICIGTMHMYTAGIGGGKK